MMSKVKQLFPIFAQNTSEFPLVYFDSAATTQRPHSVIEAMNNFYSRGNANVHRGIYRLAEQATLAHEAVRNQVAKFINASHGHEIVFTRGTTEAINLVASSYGYKNFTQGDEIIISTMEHHSNIVPWQLVAERTGAKVVAIAIDNRGELDLEHYGRLLSERTKMVAITHVSNVLGTINPLEKICKMAHDFGVPVLVDGAQAAAHLTIDVRALDCDFYAFSAHKAYGPMGVGILYGKEKILDAMPPYQGGGGMIERVTLESSSFAGLPQKFEAGTGNVGGVIALGAALDFLDSLGMKKIMTHERQLLDYAMEVLAGLNELTAIGSAPNKIGIISFILDHIHPHDIATILDSEGLALRAGHHCAMPLMNFFHLGSTARISFGVYNSKEEVDILFNKLVKVRKLLRGAIKL